MGKEINNNIKHDLDLLVIISELKQEIFEKITQLEKVLQLRAKKDYEALNRRKANE